MGALTQNLARLRGKTRPRCRYIGVSGCFPGDSLTGQFISGNEDDWVG
jgi:hypothetical protein